MESTYKGVSGYIYVAAEVQDSGFALQIPDAVASEIPVDVTGSEFLADAYEELLRAEREGLITILRYKDLTLQKKEWIRKTILLEYAEAKDHPEYQFFLRGTFPELRQDER